MEISSSPLSEKRALEMARQAGLGSLAYTTLSNQVLGNARKRKALAAAILRNATPEMRALYARFFPQPDATDGWPLLVAIAAKSA